jgi:hypothetical protein
LPKRNYGFEKRQKEIDKKRKKEEKRQRRLDRSKAATEVPGEEQPPPTELGPDQ